MRIACILDNGFEDTEFAIPFQAFKAGHTVTVIGREKGSKVTGKNEKESVMTDASIKDVTAESYDALFIPGGNSDATIKRDDRYVQFTKGFAHKPIFAGCDGPLMLIEADLARGRSMTGSPSIQSQLTKAGAKTQDRDVVVDNNIVTSRRPEDVDAFVKEALAKLKSHPRPAMV